MKDTLKALSEIITVSIGEIETIEEEYDERNSSFDLELFDLLNELRAEGDIKAWNKWLLRNTYISNRILIEQEYQIEQLLLSAKDEEALTTPQNEKREKLLTELVIARESDIVTIWQLSLLSGYSISQIRQFTSRSSSDRLEPISEKGSGKKVRFNRVYAMEWINNQ